jgi:hypothetical protein
LLLLALDNIMLVDKKSDFLFVIKVGKSVILCQIMVIPSNSK